ncbi:14061_t:CDS:2, partial [Entrophospora sp. SA101]
EYFNRIKKVKLSIEEWKTCPKAKKGKFIRDNGKFIEFPFERLVNLDMSNHRKGKFLNSPDPDDEENLYQQFFMKQCKGLIKHLDLKTKHRNDFRNEEIGHIAAFAEKALQLQPQRSFIYGVLTDCYDIMFIKVQRSTIFSDDFTNKFKYELTKKELLKYGNQGWNCFATLLVQKSEQLDWIKQQSFYEEHGSGVTLKKCIGSEHLKKLETLNSSNVPPILFSNPISIVMPLYGKVNNLQKKDISPLVKTIKRVHDLGILYWDLRKSNLLWDANSGAIVGLEVAADDILQNLIEEKNEFIYDCQFDLISIVCMFYLMLDCPTLERLSFKEKWISKNEVIISNAKKMPPLINGTLYIKKQVD